MTPTARPTHLIYSACALLALSGCAPTDTAGESGTAHDSATAVSSAAATDNNTATATATATDTDTAAATASAGASDTAAAEAEDTTTHTATTAPHPEPAADTTTDTPTEVHTPSPAGPAQGLIIYPAEEGNTTAATDAATRAAHTAGITFDTLTPNALGGIVAHTTTPLDGDTLTTLLEELAHDPAVDGVDIDQTITIAGN